MMTKIAAFFAYIKDFALKNASEAQFFLLQVTERVNVKLQIAKIYKKIKRNFENCLQMIRK